MAKIAHSELFWTTLVGKYWKSCKMAKIGHSELQLENIGKVAKWQFRSLQLENIGKVAKWLKLAILNQFRPLW